MQEKRTNATFENLNHDKLRRMLDIKQRYEQGMLTVDEAKERMKREVGRISPEEFAAAEQLHKEENPDECRNEDVRSMLNIFEGLISEDDNQLPPGHPIDIYRQENDMLRQLLLRGDELNGKGFILNPWLELLEHILPYKVHYSRKQNQLYSALERKGFDRPSTTMWTYDDEVRDAMNEAYELLQADDVDVEKFLRTYERMAVDARDLMEKEELILYPTSLKLISTDEFEDMRLGDREIGFFKVDMPDQETNALNESEYDLVSSTDDFMDDLALLLAKHGKSISTGSSSEVLDVAEGKLTLNQINLLFRHLPVDISYVDENDIVKFYTDTEKRVFPRSKGVIGRQVRNCHPPKSLHMVEEIIEKFRSGKENRAEFWINKPDLFIYIVYVAVRDKDGTFRGVMEMMQDCTHIRSLEGERRLLTWSEEHDEKESTTIEDGGLVVGADTKLKALLDKYPQLKNDLTTISPKFAMLKSPMAKVILPIATLKLMSEQSGVPQDELINNIQNLIDSY